MFIASLTVHNFICYLLFQKKKKQYSREEPWMSIYKHTWSATWPFSAYAELRNFWAWSLETWNNHSRHQLFSPDLLTFHGVGILRVLYMATIYDLEEHRRTDYVIKNYFLCFFFGYSFGYSEDLHVWRKLLTSKWSRREETATESNFTDAENATKTLEK